MEKRVVYNHGLIIGKFYPLHSGHVYLIEQALKQAKKITILVCSLSRESIPGYLRYNWLKEKFPKAHIIHIVESPESPETHDEGPDAFWKVWTDIIKQNTPSELDVVFTSEEYGDEISKRFGIKHVCIDKQRITFPISGTQIRTNPIENWCMIPDEVKHFFVKKIVLVGPESVGKSIMAEKLAEHYDTVFVPEYGRHYTEKIKKTNELKEIDFSFIAAGQLQMEDEKARRANKILIHDTDIMTTQIWSEIYLKRCPAWIARVSWSNRYDFHLLLNFDVPWVDDGTREFPRLRQYHFNRIKEELDNRKWNYEVITGTNYDERLEKAIYFIDRLINKENQ